MITCLHLQMVDGALYVGNNKQQDVYSQVFQSQLYDDMPDDERLIGILTKLKNCF